MKQKLSQEGKPHNSYLMVLGQNDPKGGSPSSVYRAASNSINIQNTSGRKFRTGPGSQSP